MYLVIDMRFPEKVINYLLDSIKNDIRRTLTIKENEKVRDVLCTYYYSLVTYMTTELPSTLINMLIENLGVVMSTARTELLQEIDREIKERIDKIISGLSDAIRDLSVELSELCKH